MRNLLLILWSAALLGACASTPRTEVSPQVRELEAWMTGTFSSAEQSSADPENFYAIRMVMIPVWQDRADGPWLYVEQAPEDRLDRPYRQRVYRLLQRDEGLVLSEIYTLPGEPLGHAACWLKEEPLKDLSPEQLTLREGCTIYLERADSGSYEGATRGKGCASSLGTATYAQSEVTIREGLLTSWDRGYDADDKQVWGPQTGPYRFVRTSTRAPGHE